MIKWWDRFWGAVWMLGSLVVAYLTARWFATNAAPADLGGLRYGLIAFAGLFGLLVGALLLSIASIGIMTGVEALLARAGHPVRRPLPTGSDLHLARRTRDDGATPADNTEADNVETEAERSEDGPRALAPSGHD